MAHSRIQKNPVAPTRWEGDPDMMKNLRVISLGLLAASALSSPLSAKEGMYTPDQLQELSDVGVEVLRPTLPRWLLGCVGPDTVP